MIEKIYSKLPKPIQYAARYAYSVIPPPIRYGKVFRDTYKFLQQSQWWSREQLEEYQFSKLKELLTFCSKYVPFYQKKWAEFGINIGTIKDFEDFARIPFTTKQDIIESSVLMMPTIYKKDNLILSNTGGTIGSKAFFYVTREAVQKEKAFFARYWNWHGYNFMKDDC
jgi:phenylacetate-CoA ligase